MKKESIKLRELDKVMVVTALLAFSIGIWANYRQLWLGSNGFTIAGISRIFSVGMFCSSFIALVITLFSTRVKTKNVMIMTLIIKSFALCALYVLNGTELNGLIKTFVLLTIMCETIYGIGIYPLVASVDRNEKVYRKYALVSYVAKDAGIVLCGFIIGVVIGNYVVNFNTCLLISLASTLAGIVFLIMFKGVNLDEEEDKPEQVQKAFVEIFKGKLQRLYFLQEIIVSIAWDIVYGLLFIILITKLGWKLTSGSMFVLVMGVAATIIASLFATKLKIKNPANAILIKYGTRIIFYIIAFIYTTPITVIIALSWGYITSRMSDDKINGIYINTIEKKYQFTFSNIRYFMIMIGESIGMFLAGFLLSMAVKYVFVGGLVFTCLATINGVIMGEHYNKHYGDKEIVSKSKKVVKKAKK